MNDVQQREYEYLYDKGASWSQAMDWCLKHPIGSSGADRNAYLASLT